MKKCLVYIATALCLANSAFATTSYLMTGPCKQHWVFGVTGIYLKPAINDHILDYAITSNSTNGTNDQVVNGSYNPGFIVNLGYQYINNDVDLKYMRIHTNDSNSTFGTPAFYASSDMRVPDALKIPTSLSGRSKVDIDQVDLTGGHKIAFCDCVGLHFYGGLRYTKLDRQFNYIDTAVTSNQASENQSGAGPLFGIDANYSISNQFGIIGEIESALIASSVSQTNKQFDSSTAISSTSNYGANMNYYTIIDGKLGLYYKTPIINNNVLLIESGYQGFNYLDAVGGHHTLGLGGLYLGATFST